MKRTKGLLLSALAFFASDIACHAQTPKAPASSVEWSLAPSEKETPKKKGSVQQNSSANAVDSEQAARLVEGRKKFFEQSSGFDNSTRWNSPGAGGSTIPGSGSGGGGESFKPGAGFSF